MARTPKEIDWNKVKTRIEAGNSAKSIAFAHDINIDTFYDRFKKEFGCNFSDYSDPAKETARDNIEYVQYQKALSGNDRMLIWLGKIKCGQKEPDQIINEERAFKFGAIMDQLSSLQAKKINSTQSSDSSLRMDDNINNSDA